MCKIYTLRECILKGYMTSSDNWEMGKPCSSVMAEAMQLSDAHSIDLSRTVDVDGNMVAMDLAGEAPHLWPPWKNTSSS